MPLGPTVHAFETVSLAGFPTDAAAIRTALRAVGGGHFDQLHALKSRFETQSLCDDASNPAREKAVRLLGKALQVKPMTQILHDVDLSGVLLQYLIERAVHDVVNAAPVLGDCSVKRVGPEVVAQNVSAFLRILRIFRLRREAVAFPDLQVHGFGLRADGPAELSPELRAVVHRKNLGEAHIHGCAGKFPFGGPLLGLRRRERMQLPTPRRFHELDRAFDRLLSAKLDLHALARRQRHQRDDLDCLLPLRYDLHAVAIAVKPDRAARPASDLF